MRDALLSTAVRCIDTVSHAVVTTTPLASNTLVGLRAFPGGEAILEWWFAVTAATKREKRAVDIVARSIA